MSDPDAASWRSALFAPISYLDVGRNNFVVMVYDFEIPSGSFGDARSQPLALSKMEPRGFWGPLCGRICI